MAQPYVGEIRMLGFSFPPNGWALCNGQILPISENETLFQLIGTTYGGNGEDNFAVPNLNGRVPMHMSGTNIIGEMAGVESVTITTQALPIHTHPMIGTSSLGTTVQPAGAIVAQSSQGSAYQLDDPNVNMNPNSIAPVGGSQPHDNMQPYLCVTFAISLFGIFPSQT
jgi:microcystin-dependent protein